jgi:hypothetical protein
MIPVIIIVLLLKQLFADGNVKIKLLCHSTLELVIRTQEIETNVKLFCPTYMLLNAGVALGRLLSKNPLDFHSITLFL